MTYNKEYYKNNKNKWKTQYYNKDKQNIRRRKFVYVLEIPDRDLFIEFKSIKQIKDLIKKQQFNPHNNPQFISFVKMN